MSLQFNQFIHFGFLENPIQIDLVINIIKRNKKCDLHDKMPVVICLPGRLECLHTDRQIYRQTNKMEMSV